MIEGHGEARSLDEADLARLEAFLRELDEDVYGFDATTPARPRPAEGGGCGVAGDRSGPGLVALALLALAYSARRRRRS